jgi:hypothetical protein
MIKRNELLVKELKESDPNGTYSKSIIKEKEKENAKLKIEGLLKEKKRLRALLLIPNPLGYALIFSRIREIDKQILSLRKEFNIKEYAAVIMDPNEKK